MKKILICGNHLQQEGPLPAMGPSGVIRGYQYSFLMDNGFFPVLVPPRLLADDEYSELLADCAGVLLFGGRDIDPLYYEEDVTCEISRHEVRDEVEFAVIRCARAQGKKMFGICRGMQILNVAFGGSLYQSITKQCTDSPLVHMQDKKTDMNKLSHMIAIDPGSFLHTAVGVDALRVNTFHNQAIKELGTGLHSIATTSDGLIEAIESDDGLIFGVERHPEISRYFDEPSQSLLDAVCTQFFV